MVSNLFRLIQKKQPQFAQLLKYLLPQDAVIRIIVVEEDDHQKEKMEDMFLSVDIKNHTRLLLIVFLKVRWTVVAVVEDAKDIDGIVEEVRSIDLDHHHATAITPIEPPGRTPLNMGMQTLFRQ